MRNNIYTIVLGFIFLIAFFLRFNQLGGIPYGFYQDESAIGYNAYSILKTGEDEYGQFLPLYFKSFGDYKLPVYIYATIPSISIFGLNEFAVRFPSALFGFLTVVVFYVFIHELTENKLLSVTSSFLLAINPWHLHYSRATFEVSIALFLFVLGGWMLYRTLQHKQSGMFLAGTFCFIISFYSYNLTRLLAPALYVLFLFFFRKEVKHIKKKELLFTCIVSFFVFIPFIKTFFENGGVGSASGTLIWSSAEVQSKLLEFRSYLVSSPAIFSKFFFNQWSLTLWQYIQNIASYVSIPFFFISGSSHGNHGIGHVGQLYLFEFPLVVIGIWKTISKRERWGVFFILWAIVVVSVSSLTREAPHATRSFFLIVPLEFFSALGLLEVGSFMWGIKRELYRKAVFVVVAGFVLYNVVYYFASYYIRFPVLYAKAWRSEDKPLSLFIKENQDKYEKIIFDTEAGFMYSSLLFYTAYSPSEFQKTVERYPDDSEGFSMVKSFRTFEFREIDWNKDYEQKNLLFITTVQRKPSEIKPLKTFSYPKRPVVLAVKQKIIQYPVEEVAYVLVESKKE